LKVKTCKGLTYPYPPSPKPPPSVFWALFKDLAVFDDEVSAQRAAVTVGSKLFYASIKESKFLPTPQILIQSGADASFLPKTGTVNSDALESRAKEKLGRVLELLSKKKGDVK
jgi:hypothetical protein